MHCDLVILGSHEPRTRQGQRITVPEKFPEYSPKLQALSTWAGHPAPPSPSASLDPPIVQSSHRWVHVRKMPGRGIMEAPAEMEVKNSARPRNGHCCV